MEVRTETRQARAALTRRPFWLVGAEPVVFVNGVHRGSGVIRGDARPFARRRGKLAVTLKFVSNTKHVVLIHGSWSRGEQWTPARAAFEERGYTVHTPTLRHHELPWMRGAGEVAPLSLRDYIDDLVALVASLDVPPLLVGHSLGGLVVQLVAARTPHAGMVAACPSPVGPAGLSGTTLRVSFGHGRQSRPWAKPVYPPTWEQFRRAAAHVQTEETVREVFVDLVCDPGGCCFSSWPFRGWIEPRPPESTPRRSRVRCW